MPVTTEDMPGDVERTGASAEAVEPRPWQQVRTFKPRRRALSPTRQARLDRLRATWLIDTGDAHTGFSETFDRDQPVVVDIGIGDGASCVDLARNHPDLNIVGVDVHTPGIAHAAFCADEDGLTNLRVYHGDVFDLFDGLSSESLAGIRVLFPDPWPKVRHRHRRLVTPERLDILVSKLGTGGFIHLATDVEEYATQIADVCGRHPELVGGPVERSRRPITRFEQRGLDAGRAVRELVFGRVAAADRARFYSASSVSIPSWASRFSRSTASMNSETIS